MTGMAKRFYLEVAPLDDLCNRKVNTKKEEYYRLLEMFAGAYLDIKIHDEQTGRDLCAFLVPVTDKYEMELLSHCGHSFSFEAPSTIDFTPGQSYPWNAHVTLINLKEGEPKMCRIAGGRGYEVVNSKRVHGSESYNIIMARSVDHVGCMTVETPYLECGRGKVSAELQLNLRIVRTEGRTVEMLAKLELYDHYLKEFCWSMSMRTMLRILGWWTEGKIRVR
jgi:hypothetical protein